MPNISIADLVVPGPGRIAVLVETKDEITPQGLYIPADSARSIHEQRPTTGKVIAMNTEVGDDLTAEDEDDGTPFVDIGDFVLFGKYTGTRVEYQSPKPPGWKTGDPIPPKQAIIIMRSGDVLAKLLTPEQASNLKVRV